MEEENIVNIFRRSNVRFQLQLLTRIIEVFASSFIPSVIAVFILLINPVQKFWDVCVVISLILFFVINASSIYRNILNLNSKKEFYIINTAAYLLFASVSIGLYVFLRNYIGAFFYSLTFSSLRFYEILNHFSFLSWLPDISTQNSILMTNATIIVGVFIISQIGFIYAERFHKKMAENGADEIEIDEEKTVITQNNKVVERMSVEKLVKHMEQEMLDDKAEKKRHIEDMPDGIWSTNIVKGRGEKIQYYNPEMPEDDFDDNDTVAANSGSVGLGGNYSSDQLWDDIYKGKDKVVEFPEDVSIPPPPMPKVGHFRAIKYSIDDHIRSLIKFISIKLNYSRNELMMRDIRSTAVGPRPINENSDYDDIELWNKDLYRGSDRDNVPERVLDFDEEVEQRAETGLEDYDSDNLWNIRKDQIFDMEKEIEESEQIVSNPNEEYDSDNLWNIDRRDKHYSPEQVDPDSVNPVGEFSSGSLWNIVRGDRDATGREGEKINYIDNNQNSSYESDSLWDNFGQGRDNRAPKTVEDDIEADKNEERSEEAADH